MSLKDTTDTQKSASYLDLHLEIDNGGRLKTKLYDRLMTSLFQLSTSPSSVPIFQHQVNHYEISISQMTMYLT